MGAHEYQLPDDRSEDSESRYARDMEAEHLEHRDTLRDERLREHVTPDPRPAKRVKRSEAPKPVEGWKLAVLDRDQGCCVCENPNECEPPFQAHHVVTAQVLRRENLTRWLWDTRIGLGVCSKAHRQHHNRTRPIFWDEIPMEVAQFIVGGIGLSPWLERHYPSRKQEEEAA